MDAITAEVVNEVVSNPMSPRAVSDYVKAKAKADDGTAKDLPSILASISQESIAREQGRTLWKSRWRQSVVIGIVAVIVAISIQFAITFASNQLSKESFVNENAQLTNKRGEVVQTVLAHNWLQNPDWNDVRQWDAGSLGSFNSITLSTGSDMEVFKINGVRIANADVPEERTVTFLSPYATIIASKDSIAFNHLDGRRLAYGPQRRLDIGDKPKDNKGVYEFVQSNILPVPNIRTAIERSWWNEFDHPWRYEKDPSVPNAEAPKPYKEY